jgi:hypothetical protein
MVERNGFAEPEASVRLVRRHRDIFGGERSEPAGSSHQAPRGDDHAIATAPDRQEDALILAGLAP